MKGRILIVDDNEKLCRILALDFENDGYTCGWVLDGSSALERFSSESWDLVLLDMRIGAEDGLAVLQSLMAVDRTVPVVIVTAFGSIGNAVEAVKLGAFDYIQKPVNFPRLREVVDNALRAVRMRRGAEVRETGPIVTRDPGMLRLFEKLDRLAATDYPIFLCGESGTGKELFADYIHLRSPRSSRKLWKINCAALPEGLLDNELFGHDRGAYTGADRSFPGIFERADRSSLFLDEIGDMSLEIQAKILRTLQNSEVRRIGGAETLRVDVRFIAATNKDIGTLVAQGSFREDLYYRLNTAVFRIPPLRERKDDILLLAERWLSEGPEREAPLVLAPETAGLLEAWDWPGNVRELKNTIDYAKAVCQRGVIHPDDLPGFFLEGRNRPSRTQAPVPAPAVPSQADERSQILEALSRTGNNRTLAAEELRISRRTLYNKLAKHGIDAP